MNSLYLGNLSIANGVARLSVGLASPQEACKGQIMRRKKNRQKINVKKVKKVK
jgi:hypothetical protein